MKILSIYPYTHISSAAIMIDGSIVAAAPEERFNRKKMSTEFPIKSIKWCMNEAKLKWKDLDLIAVPWNPSINTNNASARWTKEIRWRGEMFSHIPTEILKLINQKPPLKTEIHLDKTKIIFFNHHECHAASAFFTSPFKKSDILTIDGHGEKETCHLSYGENKTINNIRSINYPHSLGLFYGTFTDYLGYRADHDEWKVMALSSFSKKRNIYDSKINYLIKKTNTGFELDLTYFDYYSFDKRKNFFSEKFIDLFGKPRVKNTKLLKRYYEIAGALQRKFEEVSSHLLKLTNKLGKKSGNIVLAGGAAMNCVFNGLIHKYKIYKKNYVPAYPDDLGVSIGAALLAHNLYSKRKRIVKEEETIYFGPEYSKYNIEKILKKNKLSFKYYRNINQLIAKKLSQKKLVGWFQGRMEFSHRALGNRSILADPRYNDMKDIINNAVKYRESYRPFAPAVMSDFSEKIFDMPSGEKVNFMQKAFKVKNKWKKIIPAVTHVDGTARIQTVFKKNNIKFYDLISEFYKITKVPVLLNTSFNLNGEPIVCSPEDAIRTFFTCGLDILVIDNYVIDKNVY